MTNQLRLLTPADPATEAVPAPSSIKNNSSNKSATASRRQRLASPPRSTAMPGLSSRRRMSESTRKIGLEGLAEARAVLAKAQQDQAKRRTAGGNQYGSDTRAA